jgi:hypothetical protein
MLSLLILTYPSSAVWMLIAYGLTAPYGETFAKIKKQA